MSTLPARYGALCLVAIGGLIIVAAFIVSDGYLSVDEFVYTLSAASFGQDSFLRIDNGTALFTSPDLVFLNLVDGPNGLVSQYPIGTDILAGPLVAALGPRGLILLNAVASVGVIFCTWAVALRLYRDRVVALAAPFILVLGTFFVEYSLSIWPHALSVFLVIFAVYLALSALEAGSKWDAWLAAGAGASAGLAFLVRVDSVLVLPAFGLLIILYADRPVRLSVAGTLGLVPFIAIGAVANAFKFGTWNPLSYGSTSGGTMLSHYVAPIGLLAVALGLLFLLRGVAWRAAWRWPVIVVAAAGLVGLAMVVPAARTMLLQTWGGAHTLIADMTLSLDPRGGITRSDDGTVLFWGLPKKALGQSLPWIAFIPFLFLRPWHDRRRAHLFCVTLFVVWLMPFLLKDWHGGLSSNTRYFLALLPILSILAALAFSDLVKAAGGVSRTVIPGAMLGGAAVLIWRLYGPGGGPGAHQILTTYAFLGMLVFAAALAATLHLHSGFAHAGQGVMAVGLGMAAVLGLVLDMANGQGLRSRNAQIAEVLSVIPNPSVIFAPPELVAFQTQRPNGFIAYPGPLRPADARLVSDAIAQGFAVYALLSMVPELQEQDARIAPLGDPIGEAPWAITQVGLGGP